MKTPDPAHAPLSIRLAWLAAFVGASLLFTPGLGCEVPLIAFAAICGMRLARREALLFAATVWLTDELAGFITWRYPMTHAGFGWPAAVGAAILAATWAATSVARRTTGAAGIVAALLSALAVYEGLLFAAGMLAGAVTQEAFTPAIVGRVLAFNAATFAGLLAVKALQPRNGRCAHGLREVTGF